LGKRVQKKKFQKVPDFSIEDSARSKGYFFIAGVDEAGRGSWAGPVVAGAVILEADKLIPPLRSELDDSKKLTARKRQMLFEILPTCALIGVGIADVNEIDRLNILEASFLAMARAISDLPRKPGYVIVDGNKVPDLPCPSEYVVKGDSRSLSIAAASIVAKVTRDNIMVKMAKTYTGYGWERNAGYGTQEHKVALERLGVTEHHRKSYAPIIKILSKI